MQEFTQDVVGNPYAWNTLIQFVDGAENASCRYVHGQLFFDVDSVTPLKAFLDSLAAVADFLHSFLSC